MCESCDQRQEIEELRAQIMKMSIPTSLERWIIETDAGSWLSSCEMLSMEDNIREMRGSS